MTKHTTHPLIAITIIVLLSLIVAWVLFAILSSEGSFAIGSAGSFGGAAAGFFATLYGLQRWYDRLDKRLEKGKIDLESVKPVATWISKDLVNSAKKEKDPNKSLTTLFNETLQYIQLQFRSLGKEWIDALLVELRNETQLETASVPSLRGWKPPETTSDLIKEKK